MATDACIGPQRGVGPCLGQPQLSEIPPEPSFGLGMENNAKRICEALLYSLKRGPKLWKIFLWFSACLFIFDHCQQFY